MPYVYWAKLDQGVNDVNSQDKDRLRSKIEGIPYPKTHPLILEDNWQQE